jgi:hypothetical protein
MIDRRTFIGGCVAGAVGAGLPKTAGRRRALLALLRRKGVVTYRDLGSKAIDGIMQSARSATVNYRSPGRIVG